MGLAGCYRAFIPSYSRIALPLTRLKEKTREFKWTNECEEAFAVVCASCDVCHALKPPKVTPRAPLQPIPSGYPNQCLGVDIVGPVPQSKHGNVYLLVMADFFSKWAEATPLPNQEARTVADAIINHWVSRFGVPDSNHSDQGSNF